MDFSKAIEWVKLAPKHYLTVALASGLLLLLGNRFAALLGLEQIRTTYLPVIGGAFLLSTCFLAAHLITASGSFIRQKLAHRQKEKRQSAVLRNLSAREKEILRLYVYGESRTQYFGLGDGQIGGLVAQRIVYQSSNIGNMYTGFAYNIQPWALEYLQRHPELLESHDDSSDEEDEGRIETRRLPPHR